MKKEKIKSTKKDIFEAFKKLRWTFRHHGCGFYNFVTADGKELPVQIWFPQDLDRPARVEYKFPEWTGGVNFEFPRCYFEWLGINCISLIQGRIKNPPCFINFSNYDIKESVAPSLNEGRE